jgi:hypothetical protein
VKGVLCLAILATAALRADEAADRAAIEATVSALNTTPAPSSIFTADFPNAAELQRFREEAVPVVTVLISREPMGEATWYASGPMARRFITKSITFTAPTTAVVVAGFEQHTVLFIVKNTGTNWRIASFRPLPEARTR